MTSPLGRPLARWAGSEEKLFSRLSALLVRSLGASSFNATPFRPATLIDYIDHHGEFLGHIFQLMTFPLAEEGDIIHEQPKRRKAKSHSDGKWWIARLAIFGSVGDINRKDLSRLASNSLHDSHTIIYYHYIRRSVESEQQKSSAIPAAVLWFGAGDSEVLRTPAQVHELSFGTFVRLSPIMRKWNNKNKQQKSKYQKFRFPSSSLSAGFFFLSCHKIA
jgi:hypothetical protein